MTNSVDKNILTGISKIIGLVAVFSGIYGASYQKGMIISMGIGNLNGNYDIREIFNSAVFGFLEMFEAARSIEIADLMIINWPITVISIFAFIALPFFMNNRNALREKAESAQLKVKELPNRIAGSYLISPILGIILGLILNLFFVLCSGLLFAALGILLLPALLGYIMGSAHIKEAKGQEVCTELGPDLLDKRYANQCTQITINGKKIMGDVLLENSEGYFMHLNNSFMFISKKGNLCIYSKYTETRKIKDQEKFKFSLSQIDAICETPITDQSSG